LEQSDRKGKGGNPDQVRSSTPFRNFRTEIAVMTLGQ
jgi:hypothetical protein